MSVVTKSIRLVLHKVSEAPEVSKPSTKRRRGRKRKEKEPPGPSPQDRTCCANCFAKVTFENQGRKFADPLHSRPSRSKLEKILQDRSSRDTSTVLTILNIIFDISNKAQSSSVPLDEGYKLCWKCTIILTQLYKLFLEFVEAAELPSFMNSIFQQNRVLAKFQTELQTKRVEQSSEAEAEPSDDEAVIKEEPLSDQEQEEDIASFVGSLRRDTRNPRSCKRSLDYKRLSMGKVNTEADNEEGEYILPGHSPTPRKAVSPVRIPVPPIQKLRRMKKKMEVVERIDPEPETNSNDDGWNVENEIVEALEVGETKPEKKPKRKRSQAKKAVIADDDGSTEKLPCPVCQKNLKSEEVLQAHLSKAHIPNVRIRDYACPDCGKKFWTKHDLNNHIKTHTNEASFACDQCGYKTKRPQELNRHHKIVHLKELNFYCEVCNKGYALKWQLVDHARVHRDERTFPCPHPGCEKAFRTPSNLRQHAELHKGSKYVCHVCGQTYSRKAYLRLHVNAAHLGVPFPVGKKRVRDPNRPVRPRLPRTKVSDGSVPKPKRVRNPKQPVLRKISHMGMGNIDVRHKGLVHIAPKTHITIEQGPIIVGNEGEEEEDEQVLVLTEYNPDEHDLELITGEHIQHEEEVQGEDEEEEEEEEDASMNMVEVHMQLDDEGLLGVDGAEVEQHHYAISEDQQIICYPVSSMGVVQQIPMAMTVDASNNTYYITTAQAGDEAGDGQDGGLTVFNPFQEFMSIQ